jgi:hypothetical protein
LSGTATAHRPIARPRRGAFVGHDPGRGGARRAAYRTLK